MVALLSAPVTPGPIARVYWRSSVEGCVVRSCLSVVFMLAVGSVAAAQTPAGAFVVGGPAPRLDRSLFSVSTQSAFGRAARGMRVNTIGIAAQASTPTWSGMRLTTFATSGRLSSTRTLGDVKSAFLAAASFAGSTSGVWIGSGLEQTHLDDVRWRTPTVAGGFWRQRRNLLLSVSSERRGIASNEWVVNTRDVRLPDSTASDTGWIRSDYTRTFVDTVLAARARRWIDTEGRMSWARGRTGLTLVVGGRPATGPVKGAVWGSGAATIQLFRPLALTLGGGAERIAVAGPSRVRSFTRVAFRLTSDAFTSPHPTAVVASAAEFAVRPIDSVTYSVTIRAPGARVVELSGDFNGWKPIRLTRTAPDRWEASISVTPGSYRMNVRVDGGTWAAPPGTPTVSDEFKGTVGIVIVR
jgi:hypothetical protein